MKDQSKAESIARRLLDAEEDLPAPPGGQPPRRQFGPGAGGAPRRQFGPGAAGPAGPRRMGPPMRERGPLGPMDLSLLKDLVLVLVLRLGGVSPMDKPIIEKLVKGEVPDKTELSHVLDETRGWTEAGPGHKALLGKIERLVHGQPEPEAEIPEPGEPEPPASA